MVLTAETVLTLDLPENVVEETERRILEIFKGNIWTELQDKTPVDHGYLRQHWRTESGDHQVRIFNNTRYAAWLSRGTGLFGPYHTLIKPKTKKGLAWKPKGAGLKICRRSVKGIHPNPYIEDGIANGVRRSIGDLKTIMGVSE